MMNEEVLQKIEEAKASGAIRLDLSGENLTILPSKLFNLTNLKELYLASNQLSSLPPEISQLTNLMILGLGDNQLSNLPPEIFQLFNFHFNLIREFN